MSNAAWEKPANSFGVKLVKVLSKQLKGKCGIKQEEGTKFTLQMLV
jgi:two-component sensor histidine kinase